MADLASLYIKVDSKGVVTASKDLNKLTDDSKKTETATEGVTRSFSKLQAVVVALASSYALLKMAQYVKDAALLAARYETLGVVMHKVGENAGYTGAQMDKFARGLQKSGIAMVESRNILARMIQAQIDLTNSQKLARIAQDAAVIGNLNSSETFEHMIYGLQTGHPRILRTIGLNVDFNASVKALAVSLGIKKDALNEAQIMQGRANAVMKAGVLIEGTYEAAMGTAGKKLTSFIRYTEDFKVKMGEAFGPATVMLVDAATEAMKEFQDEISRPEAQKALRDLSSQLAITIVQLGQDLPKAIKSTTNAIADIQAIYNSFPEGVVGATGVGLIGRILFGGWGPAKIVAGLYLINKGMSSIGMGLGDIAKSYKDAADNFQKAWDEITGKTVKGLEFHKISESMDKFLSQYEKMQEMLSKGITTRLDFALEDPDKFFGEMKAELLAWEKEGFESIKEWYKSIETLAQENLAFMIELEDEETRMFRENLAYRLTVQKKYYEDIETAAQEARTIDEEIEDQKMRMARETADYQKKLANEKNDYIDKLAKAASYYKDLTGFEDTYHNKMIELIDAEAKERAKATGDDIAATKWAAQEKGRLEQKLFEDKTKYIDEGFSALASSFSDIAGLYDKGSDAAKKWEEASKAMEIAQKAVAVVNAVAAIANQGLGDPYTAFARIAAMTTAMAGLLASIGESIGGGGGSGASAPILPASTVLGADAGTGSQSIANAWELLEDTYDMEYRELSGIYDEMKNLNANISGLVASIFRTGGIDSSYIPTGTTLGSMESFAEDFIELTYFGFQDVFNTLTFGISGWIDNAISGLIGSIFGGGSSTSVTGSGISTGAASIGSLAGGGGIGSQQYADVHRHEEGGWFHSDKDYYYTTYKALDESVTRLFDKVFQNMSTTLIELTLGLGTDMNATLNYVFSGAKISLQGMDSDEINNTLTKYFSNLGDKAVDALFGDLLGTYQQVGEGLMETAARILIDKAVVLDTLEMTGQAFTGTIPQIIAFSEAIIAMAGDLETLRENAEKYYDKFFSDEEKQIRLQGQLTETLHDLDRVLPDARDGYQALIESFDLTTETGQKAYISLLSMSESADTYYSVLEHLAKDKMNLEIEIMTLTGDAAGALAAQRAIEFDSTNASLKPLQAHIYALEDEAAAAETAKQAILELESSLQTLVSQGQIIQDFINSLGITGEGAMTLSAARSAYTSDLARARVGDAESYNRITQSAGSLISTATQTAGSRFELTRIVAKIKSELSALQPVIDLDSNIELLKAIREATKDTAISADRLDVLGIKAIFDLTQVLTLVDNSQGLPDHLKEMIVNQTGDYKLWLKAQLDSSVSEDLKRILIAGVGIYATTVTAVLGTADEESRKLALTATGRYTTFVDSVMGADNLDENTRILALTAGNAFLTLVNTSLGVTDPIARELGLKAANTLGATVTAALGLTDPGAIALAIETANTLAATVTAALGSGNLDALTLATENVNTFATTVTAALGSGDPNALALATQDVHAMQAVIEATLAQDTTTQQLQDLLTGAGLTTTIDGTMTWNPDDPLKAIWDAIKAATQTTADNTGRYATFSSAVHFYDQMGTWSVYSGADQLLTSDSFLLTGTEIENAALIAAARPQFAEGGIATGPESGYAATLHGTELVISPSTSYPAKVMGADSPELLAEVKKLREETKAGNLANVKNSNKIAKILTRFDDDGMPAERSV